MITGPRGFVARHALARWSDAYGLGSDDCEVNILDTEAVESFLARFPPQEVLHLAGQSFVPKSFEDPEHTFQVNAIGTHRLLSALNNTGFRGRFLYVSTSDVYGLVSSHDLPLRETQLPHPRNPYAASKVAAEAICQQWSACADFDVLIARPFNHIGPGQDARFVVSGFARQFVEMRLGLRPAVLEVGNLDVSRDFSDVTDVLEAYRLLLSTGQDGEIYNVCSGIERRLDDIIKMLCEISGVHPHIEVNQNRLRPVDQPRYCGSHEKLTKVTGWQPQIDFRHTLTKLFNYWETQIGK